MAMRPLPITRDPLPTSIRESWWHHLTKTRIVFQYYHHWWRTRDFLLGKEPHRLIEVSLEFKLADMWRGVFWEYRDREAQLWWCYFPCLPVHVRIRWRD
jgi:hypothetical protein